MGKSYKKLFTWQIGVLVGCATTAVVVFLILQEESVQPVYNHRLVKEAVSLPLTGTNVFSQEVTIPEPLSGKNFMIALFFGKQENVTVGDLEITLSQGEHIQSHRVSVLVPDPILRKRFRFDGYSTGPATLLVAGVPGNTSDAPGLVYFTEGEGAQLQGPGLTGPAYTSIDWFRIFSGSEKLSGAFPNFLIRLIWLIPFSGLMALAWAGMGLIHFQRP